MADKLIIPKVDPFAAKDGQLPSFFHRDDIGHGRYFYEHWVHSHPSVEPCDLSTDNTLGYQLSLSDDIGHGRYFYEHWVHSHPSVEPCDLSTDNFVWNYNGVPSVPFAKDVQPAPRFDFKKYVMNVHERNSQLLQNQLHRIEVLSNQMTYSLGGMVILFSDHPC
eukprot:g6215.t1 g6215   contig22:9008-9673(+)